MASSRSQPPSTLSSILFLFVLVAVAVTASTTTTSASSSTTTTAAPDHAPRSSKRGLIYIDNVTPTEIFLTPPSDLTWYYNYAFTPTPSLANSTLQFIPMLWGDTATGFSAAIAAQQASTSANLTTVLAFNEPDACSGGGSCLTPARAAQLWTTELAPLQRGPRPLRIGSPATVGSPAGLAWMHAWLRACAGACVPDFLAVHWYGDFQGLASWMGQLNASFAGALTPGGGSGSGGMWITEFADPNVDLATTQSTYNTSTEYFDRLAFVQRYAYFGSFESSASNVGPNVAMLDQDGRRTDIGSWYLGGAATGNIPLASGAGAAGPLRARSSGGFWWWAGMLGAGIGVVVFVW